MRRSIYILSVTDFDPKRTIFEVRVHARLYLDILDADPSPNTVRFHVGTTQVDFEVGRLPPANSAPGDLLITMVMETVILYKKRLSKNERKSYVSLIDLKVMKPRNDCEIACECDCVKRANVVLHVGLCEEIFARKHSYRRADLCSAPHSDHDDTHTSNNRLRSPLAHGLGGNDGDSHLPALTRTVARTQRSSTCHLRCAGTEKPGGHALQ